MTPVFQNHDVRMTPALDPKQKNPDFHRKNWEILAKTSIFEVPRSRRIDPYQNFQIRSYSDPFRAKSSFLGWAGLGQASRSTEKALKNQPLGPCPCEREPHFELDSLNESSVRPNGTPVMSILRLPRFGLRRLLTQPRHPTHHFCLL